MVTVSLPLIRRSLSRGVAVAMIAAMAACNSDDTNAPTLVATSIVVVPGADNQSAVVANPTPNAISVKVLDQNGAALPNATVTWAVLTGGGTVTEPTSVTDNSGVATTAWTLGTASGANTLKASITGDQSVTITATGTAAAGTALTVVSGNNQTITSGGTTAPLLVLVADQYGNPVNAATVNWTTNAGTLSGITTSTAANGQTAVTLTSEAGVTSYNVTGTIGSASVTFAVTSN